MEAKKFSELRDKMSPERQARVAERTKEMLADMEENKVAPEPMFCKSCGKQLCDEHAAAAKKAGALIAYCSYECYCDD